MAAALLAGGCGKFVRDELIYMQQEIDAIYDQVEQMNKGVATLKTVVTEMADNGYIVSVDEYQDEEKGGYTLKFKSVHLDENGSIVSEDSYSVTLYSGVDGEPGKDAEPFVLGARQDTTDLRWYWYDLQADDWMYALDGRTRFLVDGQDGRTPELKVEDGYWQISWDGGLTWEATEWKAKGDDAKDIFSKAEVFDDRVELTLAADSTVLTLLRYLPVDVALTVDTLAVDGPVAIAPGDTVSIAYALTGTGAEHAMLVAGTDGRFKTAIRESSATEGFIDVICPAVFPEGGYIYVTVNDGNGRSIVKVVNFILAGSEEAGGENTGTGEDAGEGSGEGEKEGE